MPEDLWSYKWVVLRSIISVPFILISYVLGWFSPKMTELNLGLIDKFIWRS